MENQTQRETKEVKVGNHTLIIHTYITGREARDIESIMLDNLEIAPEIKGVKKAEVISGIKGSQVKDRQDMQVRAVVISMNGSTENILDRILDLPSIESESIMEIISDVVEPKKEHASN